MLEQLAHQYVGSFVENRLILLLCASIVGGGLSGLIHMSNVRIARVPYFVCFAFLLFASHVPQLLWLGAEGAMIGGYLWVLMIIDILVFIAYGYCLAVISMARSRDAYGHGRAAALAFLGPGVLWLLLTRSKAEQSLNRAPAMPWGVDPHDFAEAEQSQNRAPTIPLLTGGLGVFIGLIFLFTYLILKGCILAQMGRLAAGHLDPAAGYVHTSFMIRSNGLAATVREMARNTPTPMRVDVATTVTKIEVDGTTLRYIYEVMAADGFYRDPMQVQADLTKKNCNFAPIRPVIEAGATLEHVYLRPDGAEIFKMQVTKDVCGF